MTIKFSKKHIKEFKKIGVLAVYLFGSRVNGKLHGLSDFDFGITLKEPQKYKDNPLKIYTDLYDIIIDVLPKTYLRKRMKLKAYEVDIVFLQFVPISLQAKAIQGSKVLYESNKTERYIYEERVLEKYCDLRYVYNLSFKHLTERI